MCLHFEICRPVLRTVRLLQKKKKYWNDLFSQMLANAEKILSLHETLDTLCNFTERFQFVLLGWITDMSAFSCNCYR